MKKILAAILALCMVCSLLPMPALAEDASEFEGIELEEFLPEEVTLEPVVELEAIPEEAVPAPEPAEADILPELPEEIESIQLQEVLPEELEEAAEFEAGDIPIDPTTFPDDAFRTYIQTNYDVDNDGILENVEWFGIKALSIPTNVNNAKGIEYFEELTKITSAATSSDNGALIYLDVSKNTKLTYLSFSHNKVASIDLSNNTALESLFCLNNQLTSLDVSNNTKLTTLSCGENLLSSLDISNNILLESLSCVNNNLTSLDISNNTKLKRLLCYKNASLTNLDVSDCPILLQAFTDGKKFSTLNYYYYTTDKTATESTIASVINMAVDKTLNISFSVAPPPPTPTPDTSSIRGYVKRCYNNVFDRDGTESGDVGQDFWTTEIAEGRQTGASIVSVFINSAEFKSKGLSNEEVIKIIYQAMLGHDPDAAGLKYWLALLDQGLSYNAIINGFASSPEFLGICSDYGIIPGSVPVEPRDMNPQVTAFVVRCYKYALERDKAKNEVADSEINGWANILLNKTMTPQEVSFEFVLSKELKDQNLDNDAYMRRLYWLYMNREADDSGLSYWNLRLSSGTTREQVAHAFAVSPEFISIVQSFGLG